MTMVTKKKGLALRETKLMNVYTTLTMTRISGQNIEVARNKVWTFMEVKMKFTLYVPNFFIYQLHSYYLTSTHSIHS